MCAQNYVEKSYILIPMVILVYIKYYVLKFRYIGGVFRILLCNVYENKDILMQVSKTHVCIYTFNR